MSETQLTKLFTTYNIINQVHLLRCSLRVFFFPCNRVASRKQPSDSVFQFLVSVFQLLVSFVLVHSQLHTYPESCSFLFCRETLCLQQVWLCCHGKCYPVGKKRGLNSWYSCCEHKLTFNMNQLIRNTDLGQAWNPLLSPLRPLH